MCPISTKGILGFLHSFKTNPLLYQHHFSEGVWNILSMQPPQCEFMPDLHDFYIWLSLQGTPIAVLIQKCFVVRKQGKKKTRKQKQKVYFCQTTTLYSLVDVRSWIYKTKAVSTLQLSPDRWMRNKQQWLRGKHIPSKQKWDIWQNVHCI